MTIGIISIILSLASIGFSLFVYFKHDKRLKIQEEKLNQYNLNKIDVEQEEVKHANIKIYLKNKTTDHTNCTGTLVIKNVGKGIARNVSFCNYDFCGNDYRIDYPKINCKELLPNEEQERYLEWHLFASGEKKLSVLWDDDSQMRNSAEQKVNF